MGKRHRKQTTLKRAASSPFPSGGTLMYLSPQQVQSLYGQTFYGTKTKNVPVGSTALFPAGMPLPPQPNVNPQELPIQFRFPVSYNTFPVDRTLQQPDIPSFEQLRQLAKLDWGIGLCERKLLRMVLSLKLKITLTQHAIAGGAEEKGYKDEIKYFEDWFSKPDATHNVNIHEWIQQAVVEQTQIDELYIYKHRTRGRRLLALWIVDGAQIKPLLDDWGHPPEDFAYQQYPWGIPGMKYSLDQMIHRRETPATDTPYGRSCIERVIGVTNLALRKLKQDMAHYTEGNIPAGILTPPENSNWTPDLLDAYEQSWNALLAGNPQQQVRIRVTQPGFQYTPFVQPSLTAEIDRFWLNIRAAAYGIPMEALNFTETSNRSTGEIQKDTLYEQALYPYVAVYEVLLTDILQHEFEPSLHGDLFQVSFGGYEPPEDEQTKAQTLAIYTGAGILGLSNAARMAKLPEEPDALHIGRVQLTATGPIFLDDMASDEMRKAAAAAKLAGYEMAAHPPEPAQQQGNQAQESSDAEDEDVEQAEDEEDKELGQLSRFDPVHSYHGEFGHDSHAFAKPKTGKHKAGTKTKSSKPKGSKLPKKQKMIAHAQKLAARFEKLTHRKLGKKWSAAQATAARKLAGIWKEIAGSISSGNSGRIDALLDSASALAKTVFAGNAKGMNAFAGMLTSIDNANDKRQSRAIGMEHEDVEDDDEACFDDLEDVLDELEQEEDEQRVPQDVEADARQPGAMRLDPKQISAEYRRWRQRAIDDVKAGKQQRGFTTMLIPPDVHLSISQCLHGCSTADEVRTVFARAQGQESELIGGTPPLTYNLKFDIWEPEDTEQQLQRMRDEGTQYLRWVTGASVSGACPVCDKNDGEIREVGQQFSSGHRLPQTHIYCQCSVERFKERPKE